MMNVREEIDAFAINIGSEWKKLGLFLDFTWTELFQIHQRNSFQTQAAITCMLREWHTRYTGDSTGVMTTLADIHFSLTTKSLSIWENADIEDDKFLYSVAEEVGSAKWKELAFSLNFDVGRVDSWERANSLNINDAIMDMLVTWRNSFRNTTECLPKLLSALEQVACRDVAGTISRNVRTNPRMPIDIEKLKWEKDEHGNPIRLGSSSRGHVYKAKYNGEDVAVKLIHSKTKISDEVCRKLSREVQSMQHLHDEHTMDLLYLLIDDDNYRYGIITHYMPNGSLFQLLNQDPIASWPIKIQILIDVCSGMVYLHDQHIVHSDIKSANILLDSEYHGKLSEFGQARFDDAIVTKSKLRDGSIQYLSPEALDGDDCTPKAASDFWSFGVMLFEIAAELLRNTKRPDKRMPYPEGMNLVRLTRKLRVEKESPITDAQIKEKIGPDCPPVLIELTRICCSILVEDRKDFHYLLRRLSEYFLSNCQSAIIRDIENLKQAKNAGISRKSLQAMKQKIRQVDLPARRDRIDEILLKSAFDKDVLHLSMDAKTQLIQLVITKDLEHQKEHLLAILGDDAPFVKISWKSRNSMQPQYCYKRTQHVGPGAVIKLGNVLPEHQPDGVQGAIGGIVQGQDGQRYVITCMHVLETSAPEILSYHGQRHAEFTGIIQYDFDEQFSAEILSPGGVTDVPFSDHCFGLKGTMNDLQPPRPVEVDIAVLPLKDDVSEDMINTAFRRNPGGQSVPFYVMPHKLTADLNHLYAAEPVTKFGPETGRTDGIVDDVCARHLDKHGYVRVSDQHMYAQFGKKGDSGSGVVSNVPVDVADPSIDLQSSPSTEISTGAGVTYAFLDDECEEPNNTAYGSFLANTPPIESEQRHLVTNWRLQFEAVRRVFGIDLQLLPWKSA